ncbi:uncharacterized protein LOC107303473 [Oryza brachyantha]|uniref:uncharacterized protein LOC107303473 n=1 Tax=Oryza brachyantha TaxID=4533 RepID=UPI0007763FE3|nr:uncharacterized protein LOC107303473 [Oryza brachyantha]
MPGYLPCFIISDRPAKTRPCILSSSVTKMFAAESGDELKDPTYYSLDEFREERYFVRYEKDKSLGQYIHPDHIRLAGLSDYHKLVLISVSDRSSSLKPVSYFL